MLEPTQNTSLMERLDRFLINADKIVKHAKRLFNDLKFLIISLAWFFIFFRHIFHIT